jgi:hypothetical protein
MQFGLILTDKLINYTLFVISTSSDCRKMKHSSFKSSQWDKLNGGSIAFLGVIDAEIFDKT